MELENRFVVDLLDAHLEGRTFEFDLDDTFFRKLEGVIDRGTIHAEVTCERADKSFFRFSVHSKGEVVVSCDRCLADLALPIDCVDELRVQLGDEESDDGEVITVLKEDGLIDFSLPIYELIALSMPLKRVHEPGMCDEAMVQHLEQHQATRDGRDESEGDQPMSRDTRWDALRELTENKH